MILEQGFTFILPVTTFRTMVNHQDRKNVQNKLQQQVLTGVSEVMKDSNLFALFLQKHVSNTSSCMKSFLDSDSEQIKQQKHRPSTNDVVSFTYKCDQESFLMDGNIATLEWIGVSSKIGTTINTNQLSMKG